MHLHERTATVTNNAVGAVDRYSSKPSSDVCGKGRQHSACTSNASVAEMESETDSRS